ncbi:hypothetical protein DFH06DRAFT_1465450 [Mycena polygramma]|nr:hypothetical protein DFH06DRAFT_1465450 [Mycena polygramma]
MVEAGLSREPSRGNTTYNSKFTNIQDTDFTVGGPPQLVTATVSLEAYQLTAINRIRMFPFEDIDLLREIRLENGVAIFNRRQERGCLRRRHSANIGGRKAAVAAVVYQGDDAHQEWEQDIAQYMSVRHPNIVQVFGAASSGNIHATLFNDDLIPVRHFMDLYRHSPILTVYIYGYCSTQLEDADSYFYETFNRGLFQDSEDQNAIWIPSSYQSSEVFNATVLLGSFPLCQWASHQWLSQANHTFDRLDISSNLEEFAIVDEVEFSLNVSAPTSDPPNGFLFLCPAKHFQAGPFAFTWPECAAYWSLDSSGVEPLSTEDATNLGFPSIEFATRIFGKSWPASVYSGLRQFHLAKGFNPNGQDVARHLGFSLCHLSNTTEAPFAHVGDDDYSADEDRVHLNNWEDSNESF